MLFEANSVTIESLGTFKIRKSTNAIGCIDPRQVDIGVHEVGACRRPGASLGECMALVGAANMEGNKQTLTVEGAVNVVYLSHRKRGMRFTYHSDHASHASSEASLGCGHFANAINNPSAYLLESDQPDRILKSVRRTERSFQSSIRGAAMAIGYMFSGGHTDKSVLAGHHSEKAVLLVKGAQQTVDPVIRDAEGNSVVECFRYDQTRDTQNLHELWLMAIQCGYAVSWENLQAVSNKQLGASVAKLAHGLRQIEIDFSGIRIFKPVVSELGVVGQ